MEQIILSIFSKTVFHIIQNLISQKCTFVKYGFRNKFNWSRLLILILSSFQFRIKTFLLTCIQPPVEFIEKLFGFLFPPPFAFLSLWIVIKFSGLKYTQMWSFNKPYCTTKTRTKFMGIVWKITWMDKKFSEQGSFTYE